MSRDWNISNLGDVLQKTTTVNPRNAPDNEFEYIDVSSVSRYTFRIEQTTRLSGSEAPSRARRKVETGDVLFATVRPTLRRIAIVPNTLDGEVCSTGYFVLRPTKELDNRFLYHYLFTSSFGDEIERRQRGASYPAVNDNDVREQQICFPPLPEQKRIVAILDEAFAAIDKAIANTEKNLANARELFESYLNNVFTQKGEGWVEKKLGEVCTFQGGSQPPKSFFSKEQQSEFVRFIQIRDYKSNKHIVYIPKEKARRFCSAEDVMIGRYGPPLFQILRGIDGAYNVALMKAIPTEEYLSKDFLYYFLKNGNILRYIINASNRAAGQIGLNKATLEPYPIAFPDKTEQARVVVLIETIQKKTQCLLTSYQQKLTLLTELKQSILQKAFSGELTAGTVQRKKSA